MAKRVAHACPNYPWLPGCCRSSLTGDSTRRRRRVRNLFQHWGVASDVRRTARVRLAASGAALEFRRLRVVLFPGRPRRKLGTEHAGCTRFLRPEHQLVVSSRGPGFANRRLDVPTVVIPDISASVKRRDRAIGTLLHLNQGSLLPRGVVHMHSKIGLDVV